MKKNGKYRFSLQFGMDSEEEIQAGELLERLGNRKSAVVIAAIGEYLQTHPELRSAECKVNVCLTGIKENRLEEMIRQIVEERLSKTGSSEAHHGDEASEAIPEAAILGMLDDLDIFNA